MDQPDAGLWEFRHIAQRHCYTCLFHWAGSHAAIRVAQSVGNKKLAAKATRLLKIAEDHLEQYFNAERGAYSNATGPKDLDASTIQLITMGYLDPNSERTKHHLVELEKELKTPEGLFYRYRHEDDFGTPELRSSSAPFWCVEALACVGRLDEAIAEFEQLITYANHLGKDLSVPS